jgi:hypothetical protein
MQNALATVSPKKLPTDNWDAAGDEMGPVRGPNIKFDAGTYSAGREKTPIEPDRKFVVIDRAEGWQFLKKDCPAEWVMRIPGEPRPEQPFAAEDTWPTGLNGEPEHPWKWTRFVYLIDAATGESLTFSSSTNGGRIGIDELTAQKIHAQHAAGRSADHHARQPDVQNKVRPKAAAVLQNRRLESPRRRRQCT